MYYAATHAELLHDHRSYGFDISGEDSTFNWRLVILILSECFDCL